MVKFSVLMSLYIKEKPEYFIQCMDSILNQTVKPNQIVIVKDGPLSEELDKILNRYMYLDNSLYTIVKFEKNVGLEGSIS
jgi:glycosyltransferase involved in cell wall biosynthesis